VLGQQAIELDSVLPVDPQVTVGTLENGLRYYIRRNVRPENRAELRLVLNAGSVLEDEDQRGLAHFVEHMAFNGTKRFPKQVLIDYLELVGMRFGPDLNAYTSFDETVYMLQVPTDSAEILRKAFEILEDWAHQLEFEPEMVDGERGVVIEEWRLGRGAESRMLDQQLPILFRDSKYADRLPIGDKATLETFERDALVRFYRDWYRPDLMAVIAVGDFDPEAIEGLIRDHFSQLVLADEPRQREIFPVPDHAETLVAIATDHEATSSSVSIYYKQPLREGHQTYGGYRRMLIERLYNSMLNDRLFELTQQSDPPILYGSSGQGRLIRSKEVYVLAAGVEDGGIERGLATLLTEAERVARHGFTPTEFDRAKRQLLRWMESAYAERAKTNSAAYAYEYTRAFLEGEAIPGVELEYALQQEMMPGIRLEEVNQLARAWLTDRNRVILANSPAKESLAVPTKADLLTTFSAVQNSEIAPYEDSVDEAPLVANEPVPGEIVAEEYIDAVNVTVWRLSNGAKVILKPTDFKDDEILFRGESPGGTSLASDEDYVAASTAASVVSAGGLGEFGLVELQKKLAGRSVSVNPSIGSLFEGVSGSVSPDDVTTMFELVYLTFTAPRRDTTAYQAYRSQINAFLSNRDASPDAAFSDTLKVTLSQYHIRARPSTVAVYEEMDLDKSFEFYRDRFADAGDFTFVFAGSFEPDELRPLVAKYIASLPTNGRVESWRDVGIRPPTGVVEKVVRRGVEPRSQTHVVFSGPFEYTRKNRHVIRSLSELLQIKLRERLREDLAGTYGVSVSAAPERDPVPSFSMTVRFGAEPGRLEELTSVVFDEINELKANGPSQTDLDKVKEAQRRSRETSLKQNGYWLYQLLFADRFGTDPGDILTYESLIQELDAETLREAAAEYLPTDNYVRVSLYPESVVP
jgi:zinc protease